MYQNMRLCSEVFFLVAPTQEGEKNLSQERKFPFPRPFFSEKKIVTFRLIGVAFDFKLKQLRSLTPSLTYNPSFLLIPPSR